MTGPNEFASDATGLANVSREGLLMSWWTFGHVSAVRTEQTAQNSDPVFWVRTFELQTLTLAGHLVVERV